MTDYGTWADSTAMDMRAYFEANRPLSAWEKVFGRDPYVESCVADDLMVGLIEIVIAADRARSARAATQPSDATLRMAKIMGCDFVPNACTIPPEGWWCSREAGHEGPCAAREVTPPWYAKLIAELRGPPYWSAEYGPDDARLDIAPRHASDALEIALAALQAVKRVALACEGTSYDLILSYADNALRAKPSCGFWRAPTAPSVNGPDHG